MREAFSRLLSSVKAWTLILGMFATAGASLLARYSLEVSTETVQQVAITVAGMFAVLIGAQGLTDAGKEAAKIKATSATTVAELAPDPAPANQTVVVQAPASGEIITTSLPGPGES